MCALLAQSKPAGKRTSKMHWVFFVLVTVKVAQEITTSQIKAVTFTRLVAETCGGLKDLLRVHVGGNVFGKLC